MYRAFCFFILRFGIIDCFEFSWDQIHAKLMKPPAGWMEKQIQEDLAPFYEKGVTLDQIEKTIRDVYAVPSGWMAGLVHYQIRDNQIKMTSRSESAEDSRVAHLIEVLKDLATGLPLPEIDFLASLWDSYDNPLYLENTHCPVFTICKMKENRKGVLYPEFRHFSYRLRIFKDINWTSQHVPWEQKNEKAYWRGMSSGWNYSLLGWDSRPRSRLVLFSKEYPDLADAAFTSPYSLEKTVKEWMEFYGLFQPWNYPTDHLKYKYLISIDGNTFASNLWWQLLSNSAVLKNDSEYLEWFYKGLEPYVHYIPFSFDVSDLGEKIKMLQADDSATKNIAEQGRAFALEHLSNEDLMIYFYRLLWAYSELFNKQEDL